MQNLALVRHAYVKTHDISEKERVYNFFLKNAHKFQKISYSGIIPFVYVGKEEILKYMCYEVHMNRIANQKEILKWLPFKNLKSELLNIYCAYIGDICTHVY